MSRTYRVTGMTCGGCVRAVTKAIERRQPGAEVTIDLATGLVEVAGAPADAEIRAAVETAGFEFRGVA